MIVADMLALLKHCLMEPASGNDQFTDPELLRLLNRGFAFLQTQLLAVNNNAVMAVDSVGIVQGSNLIVMPQGNLAVTAISRLSDGQRLYKRSPAWMDNTFGFLKGTGLTVGPVGEKPTDWTMFGRYVRIGPIPSVTVATALAVEYVPSLSVPADNPNYVPQVADPLLDIVINKAWSLGLRPSADLAQHAAAAKALADSMSILPTLSGTPSSMQVLPDFDTVDGFFDDQGDESNGTYSR